MIKILDRTLLQDLTEKAQKNPRLRQNHNLHDSYEEPCQRLVIAMEPFSYLRPHRHLVNPKIEFFLALRGRLTLLIFSDSGEVEKSIALSPLGDTAGAEIPPGIWHTVVSLEKGSAFFEAKPGPFLPISMGDFAPWAPVEGTLEAAEYIKQLVMAAQTSEK